MTVVPGKVWRPPVMATVAGLLLVGLGLSCRRQAAPAPDVLAVVGGTAIRVADLQAFMEKTRAGREALAARARAEGLAEDPAVRQACRDVLIAFCRQKHLGSQLESIRIPPEEVEAAYAANAARYAQPARLHLAFLRLPVGRKSVEEQTAALAAVRSEALGLPPDVVGFGRLAINNCDDQVARYRGGDAGWVTVGRPHATLPEAVVAAAMALEQPGQISEVIPAEKAVYLVRLLARRPAATAPLDQVAGEIERDLRKQRLERLEREFAEETRRGVEIWRRPDPDRLRAVTWAVRPGEDAPPDLP